MINVENMDEIAELSRNWTDNGNETISCPYCGTWFPKERCPYMNYCGYCGKKVEWGKKVK